MGLGDGPRRHEPARAPTEDREPIGLRPALLDGVIRRTVDVAIGSIAEVLVNGVQEVGTVTGRTPVFRLDHDVTLTGENSGPSIDSDSVVALRTAVRHDEERITAPLDEAGGKRRDPLQPDPLRACPVDHLLWPHIDLRKLVVPNAGYLFRAGLQGDGDVGHVLSIAKLENQGWATHVDIGNDRHFLELIGASERTVFEEVALGIHAPIHLDPDPPEAVAGKGHG